MNKVFLLGNIGKEIEIKYSNDKAIARFSLAVKRKFAREGEQDTDWLNIVAFSKLAEFCEKWLHKGSKIIVIGRIATGSYTDKDGNKRYTTDIIADEIEFAQSKKDEEANQNNAPQEDSGFANVPDEKPDDGFMTVDDSDDSDLPFC